MDKQLKQELSIFQFSLRWRPLQCVNRPPNLLQPVIKHILISSMLFTLINILVAQDMTGSSNYGLH